MVGPLDFSWAEVGKRIRDRRQQMGMSQQALAAAAGITQNGVFRLETGETNPQLSTLQQIASALGCPVRDLVCGSSESTPILADRFLRVRRIVESRDPAAISIMNNGIEAAELFLERVVRKLKEPPLRRIVKGQGRRSPADNLLWTKGPLQRRSDARTVTDAVQKVSKTFRNSGATHGTSAKSEKH
jgi:transcriptional regulator with XRE-family HTH domain